MNESMNLHLHSENFDLCRICLFEPESNREIKFYNVFSVHEKDFMLNAKIMEFLGLEIEKDDVTPKIICQNCYTQVLTWVQMKEKAHENQAVINYIKKTRYDEAPVTLGISALPESNQAASSSNTGTSLLSRNNSFYSNSHLESIHFKPNTSQKSVQNILSNTTTQDNQSESDDETAFQVVTTAVDEIICVSDSQSSDDESIQNAFNDDELKLIYCSICKEEKIYGHDYSKCNKEFSTCLVPSCNMLFRSFRSFAPHYRQHIGMSARAVLCRCCYKENKNSERDENGRHDNNCCIALFRCYICNISFKNMSVLAIHKLKVHNARLLNTSGNYLCFYCEKTSSGLITMNEHIKVCHKKQLEGTITQTPSDLKPTEGNIEKGQTIPLTSKHMLFTCVEPSCNLIFQQFDVFKFHHREHFNINREILICWQCCSTFANVHSLRTHQSKCNCRTPGMFKCKCSEKFNDIESLSIHKFLFHCGELISIRKTIMCTYCKIQINIPTFKTHLMNCHTNKQKEVTNKPTNIKNKGCASYECQIFDKVCSTSQASSNHFRTHSTSSTKLSSILKKRKFDELTKTSENNQSKLLTRTTSDIEESDVEMNILPSTYLRNGPIVSGECLITNSSSIEYTDEKRHLRYRTSLNNESSSIGHGMTLCVEKSYSCSECPKTFSSNRELSIHLKSHSGVKVVSEVIGQNYYCTTCKEYFSCSGFSNHWKSSHGKRPSCHKHKQFNCSECNCKFKYKKALVMHKKKEHNEPENPVNVETNKLISPQIVLPVIHSVMTLVSKDGKNPMENGVKNYEETSN